MVNSVGEIVQGNVLLVIASEATQSRCWRRQRARREIASSARLLAMTLNGLLAMAPLIPQRTACA